jgi:predicted DNA-binding transcriptional regulator AlpA
MELYHLEHHRQNASRRASVLPSSPLGLLDQTETAAVLGVSAPMLRKIKANDPNFPTPFRLGKRRCIRLEDLQQWAALAAQAANAHAA